MNMPPPRFGVLAVPTPLYNIGKNRASFQPTRVVHPGPTTSLLAIRITVPDLDHWRQASEPETGSEPIHAPERYVGSKLGAERIAYAAWLVARGKARFRFPVTALSPETCRIVRIVRTRRREGASHPKWACRCRRSL